MGGVEQEQPLDDFGMNITDIDESDNDATDTRASSPSKTQHSPFDPRFSPHRRRLQLIITASIVVLAVILILGSTAPVRELIGSIFIRTAPTPIPTLAPGVDLFYVRGNPPWGHLSIDEHVVSRLPRMSIDPPLRLSQGQHVLLWRADPFMPLSCTVSVPARYATDTCVHNEVVQAISGPSASVITISASLATLPGNQRAALIQEAQAALDAQQSTDTVRPGEYYILSPASPECRPAPLEPSCYATAKQPLKATLSFQLDANEASNESCIGPESSCTFSHQNCHLFCSGFASSSSVTQAWDVLAPVRFLWKFETLNGRVLAHDISDNSLWDYTTGQAIDESLVVLHITWDSLGWHVTVPANVSIQSSSFLNPACAAVQDEVLPLNPPADANGTPVYMQWQYASGKLPAAGCVAEGTPQPNGYTTPTPTHSPPLVTYCLHRFGVLVAANNEAHRQWPYLPLADTYEQQLAQQLTAYIVGSPS